MNDFPQTDLMIVGFASIVMLLIFGATCWLKAGYSLDRAWVWVFISLALQFAIYPLCVISVGDWTTFDYYCQGNANSYRTWIICCSVAVFCISFCVAYLRSSPRVKGPPPRRQGVDTSFLRGLIYVGFFCVAIACVVFIRSKGLADAGMTDGKHTGDSSGWAIDLHLFGVVPIVYFMTTPRLRLFGLALLSTYVGLRLVMDAHDRFSIIVPPMAMTLWVWRYGGGMEKRAALVGAAALIFLLVVRGHYKGVEYLEDKAESESSLGSFAQKISAGADVAMVANFYTHLNGVEAHGYSYGLPIVQTLTTEYIPRSVAPWKNSIFEFVEGMRFNNNSNWIMRAGKSSVIGGFYGYGGLIGVIIGGAFIGWVCRKADHWVSSEQFISARPVVLCFLASLWLICISRPEWGIKMMLMMAAPWFISIFLESCYRLAMGEGQYVPRNTPRRAASLANARSYSARIKH